MLKISSKRRRTQAQIKADKEDAANKESVAQAKEAEIAQLRQEMQQLQQDVQTGKVAANLMSQFIESGFVNQDEDGEFVVHGNGGDSKFKPFESH